MHWLWCKEWFGRDRNGYEETHEEIIAVFPVTDNHGLDQGGDRMWNCGKTKVLFWRRNDWICCIGRDKEKGGLKGNKFLVLVLDLGVQPFGISGPHWKKSCLGLHIKYTNTNEN